MNDKLNDSTIKAIAKVLANCLAINRIGQYQAEFRYEADPHTVFVQVKKGGTSDEILWGHPGHGTTAYLGDPDAKRDLMRIAQVLEDEFLLPELPYVDLLKEMLRKGGQPS